MSFKSGFLSLSTTRHLMILDNHRSLLTQLCTHIKQIKDTVGDDNMLKEKDAVEITAALNMLIDEHMNLHSGCSFLKLFPKLRTWKCLFILIYVFSNCSDTEQLSLKLVGGD